MVLHILFTTYIYIENGYKSKRRRRRVKKLCVWLLQSMIYILAASILLCRSLRNVSLIHYMHVYD